MMSLGQARHGDTELRAALLAGDSSRALRLVSGSGCKAPGDPGDGASLLSVCILQPA